MVTWVTWTFSVSSFNKSKNIARMDWWFLVLAHEFENTSMHRCHNCISSIILHIHKHAGNIKRGINQDSLN